MSSPRHRVTLAVDVHGELADVLATVRAMLASGELAVLFTDGNPGVGVGEIACRVAPTSDGPRMLDVSSLTGGDAPISADAFLADNAFDDADSAAIRALLAGESYALPVQGGYAWIHCIA